MSNESSIWGAFSGSSPTSEHQNLMSDSSSVVVAADTEHNYSATSRSVPDASNARNNIARRSHGGNTSSRNSMTANNRNEIYANDGNDNLSVVYQLSTGLHHLGGGRAINLISASADGSTEAAAAVIPPTSSQSLEENSSENQVVENSQRAYNNAREANINISNFNHSTIRSAAVCKTLQNPLNPNPNITSTQGEINHFVRLSQDFAALYLNQELSDVIFVVSGQRFASHRVILASRSEYFRVLLFGSFKESQSCMDEFIIEDTTPLAFGALLKYIYTGKLTVSEYTESDVLDILGLAHKYRFELLEESISSYLKISLTIENVCLIYDVSLLYNLNALTSICKEFLDMNAIHVMQHSSFLSLSLNAICELLDRDSFYAPELDIFKAVSEWQRHNFPHAVFSCAKDDEAVAAQLLSDEIVSSGGEGVTTFIRDEKCKKVIERIRLTLIDLKDILDIVRHSGLYTAEELLDAIKFQSETNDIDLKYRGCITVDENVAHWSKNTVVLQGCKKLIEGFPPKESQVASDSSHMSYSYNEDMGFGGSSSNETEASHSRNINHHSTCKCGLESSGVSCTNSHAAIGSSSTDAIIIKLGKDYIINTIKLLLWDKDHRSYSYYVEVSVNKREWVKVCDYSNFLCRSWQLIQFNARVVRYVRIVGVQNTYNKTFHVVSVKCLYSTSQLQVAVNNNGFICPVDNVASTKENASVCEGVSRSRNALINGDTDNYDWDMGYTCHQLGSGSIVIQLCQPFWLSSMRMLLWDCDSRTYSYLIEISNDQKQWTRVCDRTKHDCKGWQYAKFDEPVVATFIKLVGTRNTANEVFHVVHFETPAVTFTTEEERTSLLSGESTYLNIWPNPNL